MSKVYRRRFLQLAAVTGLGVSAYSWHRGIRFPTLSWEPHALDKRHEFRSVVIECEDAIRIPTQDQNDLRFRAYAPQPKLTLHSTSAEELTIEVANVAADAELLVEGEADVQEQADLGNRKLAVHLAPESPSTISWTVPDLDSYSFAAIGDTGGDKELAWCIERAHQLGVRFLIHLGDFNYQPGDYDRTIELLNAAPIPCYVSIGNHDFHDDGLIYGKFLDHIGPLNNSFSIGKTRFANIDTASNMLPYSGGLRGKLFKKLITEKDRFTDTVAFTHRPLHDPAPDTHHDLGSEAERDWLIDALKRANIKTLLSGHIHIYDRSEFHGIDNIIAGQGLGHQDLITNRDYSKLVIGQVDRSGAVEYTTAPLSMPMELHCHPRVDVVKESLKNAPHADVIRQIDLACEKT